jgi:hypothetical protein
MDIAIPWIKNFDNNFMNNVDSVSYIVGSTIVYIYSMRLQRVDRQRYHALTLQPSIVTNVGQLCHG